MTDTMICATDGCDESTEDFGRYSPVDEQTYCESCEQNDLQYASTVVIFGPSTEEPTKFRIGDLFQIDQWGEEPDGFTFTRTYTRTDGWRGYHTTTIEGWESTGLEGWMTGNWGDATGDRKQTFADWLQGLLDGDEDYPPMEIAVAFDPTSNVFSTATTVYVRDGQVDEFKTWLNGEYASLEDALT
jgi:hypothetical protein